MKESRFIELVNLYIDRQISADETGELEAEIQANPRRRQVYHQYCKMHRATTLVYEGFRSHAAATKPSADAAQATIERLERRQKNRRQTRWVYLAGGLAAAACIAFALVRTLPASAPAASAPAMALAAAPAVPTPAAKAAPAPVESAARPTFVALHNQLDAENYAALVAALRLDPQRALSLSGRTHAGSLPASLFDDEVFDNRQVLPAEARRLLNGKRQADQAAEFTAFKFQR